MQSVMTGRPWQQPFRQALNLAAARWKYKMNPLVTGPWQPPIASETNPETSQAEPFLDTEHQRKRSRAPHACLLARRGGTGCWIPSTARAALWACGSTRSAWACWMLGRRAQACSAPLPYMVASVQPARDGRELVDGNPTAQARCVRNLH